MQIVTKSLFINDYLLSFDINDEMSKILKTDIFDRKYWIIYVSDIDRANRCQQLSFFVKTN